MYQNYDEFVEYVLQEIATEYDKYYSQKYYSIEENGLLND